MNYYLLKLHNTILNYSNSKCAIYILALISFSESAFFILPPDFLLIPMALLNPKKAFLFAFIAGLFSVFGGIFGYIIGYYFYDYIGLNIINYLNYEKKFQLLAEYYDKYSFLAIFIAGLTPFPYKIITLFSGFVKANVVVFIIASIISRFSRFFLVVLLIYYYGNKTTLIIKNHIGKITIILAIIIAIIIYYILFW